MSDTVERAVSLSAVLAIVTRQQDEYGPASGFRMVLNEVAERIRALPTAPAAESRRALTLLGNILQALESVGAPLDDGPPDPELGPVIHAPSAIMAIARQRDDYAAASQIASASASCVEDVVLAVARAIGLDHEPPGSVDELLDECRRLAAASASAEVEVLERLKDEVRRLYITIGVDDILVARGQVFRLLDVAITEARARQPQPAPEAAPMRDERLDPIGPGSGKPAFWPFGTAVKVPEAPAPEAAAGEVADLLREAEDMAACRIDRDAIVLRKLVAAMRASEGEQILARNYRQNADMVIADLRAKLEQAEAARAEAERALATCRETLDEERRDVDTLGAKLEAAEKRVAEAERGFASIDAQMRGYRDHAEGLEKRLAALDVAVPVDVEALVDDLEDVFKRAADDAFSVGELATRSGIEEVVRHAMQHVARAMMTERVLAAFHDSFHAAHAHADDPMHGGHQRVRNGMRAALTEALGGVVEAPSVEPERRPCPVEYRWIDAWRDGYVNHADQADDALWHGEAKEMAKLLAFLWDEHEAERARRGGSNG